MKTSHNTIATLLILIALAVLAMGCPSNTCPTTEAETAAHLAIIGKLRTDLAAETKRADRNYSGWAISHKKLLAALNKAKTNRQTKNKTAKKEKAEKPHLYTTFLRLVDQNTALKRLPRISLRLGADSTTYPPHRTDTDCEWEWKGGDKESGYKWVSSTKMPKTVAAGSQSQKKKWLEKNCNPHRIRSWGTLLNNSLANLVRDTKSGSSGVRLFDKLLDRGTKTLLQQAMKPTLRKTVLRAVINNRTLSSLLYKKSKPSLVTAFSIIPRRERLNLVDALEEASKVFNKYRHWRQKRYFNAVLDTKDIAMETFRDYPPYDVKDEDVNIDMDDWQWARAWIFRRIRDDGWSLAQMRYWVKRIHTDLSKAHQQIEAGKFKPPALKSTPGSSGTSSKTSVKACIANMKKLTGGFVDEAKLRTRCQNKK